MEPEATSQVKSSQVNWGERQIGAESCFCLLSFAQKLRDEEMSSLLQPSNISSYFNITALQSVKDIQVQEYRNTMLKDFCHQPQISSKEALVIEIQSVGPTTICQKDVLVEVVFP